QEMRITYRSLIILTQASETAREMELFNEAKQRYLASEKQLADLFQSAPETIQREKDLMALVQSMRPQALSLAEQLANLGLQNRADEAKELMLTQVTPVMRKLIDVLKAVRDMEDQLNQEAAKSAEVHHIAARSSPTCTTSPTRLLPPRNRSTPWPRRSPSPRWSKPPALSSLRPRWRR